jgi:hypothetical protein
MSSDKFIPTPAGTPIAAPTSVQSFMRRQVFPRAPVTNDSWSGGREAHFSFRASGTDCFVATQSRLVLKMHVRSNIAEAGGELAGVPAGDTHKRPSLESVRLAQDPVARAFSSARLSLGGVTVTNTGADVQDIATLIGRTQGTKPGGAAGGSAGMVGFDDRMFQREETESADVANLTFTAQAERNPKQDILLEALGQEFEVSTPLGNLIPFFMQDKTYMRNTEFDVRFVVSSHFDTDMLVTKAVPATARNRGIEVTQDGTTAAIVAAVNRTVPQLLPAIDAAGANTHKIVVTDCFIDACFATPSAPLPPLRSMQIPFSDITLYTRPLAANQTSFTETFSGIPPSTSAVIVALRSETHGLAADRERYLLGGSGSGFKNFQLTAGQFVAPQPSYNLNFPNRNASRAMADFVDFVGGSARDGAGAFSYNEYCDAPILCFRLLQPKGTYSPTATARIELLAGAAANTTLLVACVHQRALEMFWADGGDLPTQVTVDEVIA